MVSRDLSLSLLNCITKKYATYSQSFHIFPLSLVIIVGFNASDFVAVEGEPVEVCLALFFGELETDVAFSISITEITGALMKQHCFSDITV